MAGRRRRRNTTSTKDSRNPNTEFVAKGNASCVAGEKKQNVEFMAFAKKHGIRKGRTDQAQRQLVDAVFVPNIQSQIDSVKALGAPSGQEQKVASALEAAQEALNKVKAKPDIAFSKPSPFKAAGEQLHALGLTECAKET